ncbi:MAG: hypothetical protein IKS15_03600 [Opitutales bacterium]|nr:hypothetical protein [Opitutales bacterium]
MKIKKIALLFAALLCANFAMAINLPGGLANAAAAQTASASDKAAVAALMQDFQNSFASVNENSTVADFKKAAQAFKNIDASKCPAAVKEKFDALRGEMSSYADAVQKILKEYNIQDSDILGAVSKLHPDLAQNVEKYAASLQKSVHEFIFAAAPYLK